MNGVGRNNLLATTAPARSTTGPENGARFGRFLVIDVIGRGGMGVVLRAYDPELERTVALKLIAPEVGGRADSNAQAQCVREARAMAQLSDPHVVTVFDVGRCGDQVFIAMELVEGTTFKAWLAQPRPWRDIVAMFIAAGRGLAAAHRAGLVHRDFKPENVLIGRDGQPKVSDFGLAARVASEEMRDAAAGRAGTPCFMSPEQWAGDELDAKSDQFSFCAALWLAVMGTAPFAGNTASEIRASVLRGALAVPDARRAPRWLAAVLARGLARDPHERWPDLERLLAALRTRLRARGRALSLAAAVGVLALGVGITAWLRSPVALDPCPDPVDRISAVWGPGRAIAVLASSRKLDPVDGALRATRLARVLDSDTRAWRAAYVSACRASRVEGWQSDHTLELRMRCLDGWLHELDGTVAAAEGARSRDDAERAVRAALELAPLDECANTRALAEAIDTPFTAVARALEREIRDIVIAERVGRPEGLRARVDRVVAAARTLGPTVTLVAALAARARIESRAGEYTAQRATLLELAQVAARAHDDRNAAQAWSMLVKVLGFDLGKADEARVLMPVADAAVVRAGDPIDLRAALAYREAAILDIGDHVQEALDLLRAARAGLEAAGAGAPESPLAVLLVDVISETGSAYAALGSDHAAEAIANLREAIARYQAVLGPDSDDEAYPWQNLGALYQTLNDPAKATLAFANAARIRELRGGESVALARALVAVGSTLNDLHRYREALAVFDRADRIERARLGGDQLERAGVLIGRGMSHTELGEDQLARADLDEAIALFDRAQSAGTNLFSALLNRAELAERRGRCEEALADYRRGAAVTEQLRGANSSMLAYTLVGVAACLVKLGHPGDALPVLARIDALPPDASTAAYVARGKYYHGRALVETGQDRAGGLAMARAARPAVDPTLLAWTRDELDRWLAANSRPLGAGR